MKKAKVQNLSTKNDPVLQDLPLACADEKAAVEFLEAQRWGEHPACPGCGDADVYQMTDSKTGERQKNFRWRCRGCKDQFTVRIGTVFEDSRIPLRHWCFAFWRASTSKKGVSALEIHRQTGVSYKSALFMLHRIRFAMAPATDELPPLDGIVEADETYVGGKPRHRNKRYSHPAKKYNYHQEKLPVVAVLQRGGGVRASVVTGVTSKNLRKVLSENVNTSAALMTDELPAYKNIGQNYADHQSVNHGRYEYVRGIAHVNTAESFFALMKRGLHGIYHSVSKRHLHRYVAHAAFLYNNRNLEDGERVTSTILAAEGKRLFYKWPAPK